MRRRVFERVSVQGLALACCGALGTASLLGLAGCPANLEDPQRFNQTVAVGGGSPAGGSGAAGTGVTVDTACLTKIFADNCVTCHFSGAPAALGAGLDLNSAGVASRLVNVPAMHMVVAAGAVCPAAKLIDTSNPSASWLLAKISGTQGTCGAAMPLAGGMLTSDQIACVTTFAMAEAAATGATAAGSGSTMGGAGGATSSTSSAGSPAAGTSAGSGGT